MDHQKISNITKKLCKFVSVILFRTISESFMEIQRIVFELLAVVWGRGWEWQRYVVYTYASNFFLVLINISLSIYKNEKITKSVPLLKSHPYDRWLGKQTSWEPPRSQFSIQIVFFTFQRKSLETNICWQLVILFLCLIRFYLR